MDIRQQQFQQRSGDKKVSYLSDFFDSMISNTSNPKNSTTFKKTKDYIQSLTNSDQGNQELTNIFETILLSEAQSKEKKLGEQHDIAHQIQALRAKELSLETEDADEYLERMLAKIS